MEYVVIGGVVFLIGSCFAAIVLMPPIRIRRPVSGGAGAGPGAGFPPHTRRPRRRQARIPPRLSSVAPVTPEPDLSPPPFVSGRKSVPAAFCGDSAACDAAPYSPQELRNLLQKP